MTPMVPTEPLFLYNTHMCYSKGQLMEQEPI